MGKKLLNMTVVRPDLSQINLLQGIVRYVVFRAPVLVTALWFAATPATIDLYGAFVSKHGDQDALRDYLERPEVTTLLGYILLVMIGLFLFMLALTHEKTGLQDMISKTRVVPLCRRRNPSPTNSRNRGVNISRQQP